MSAKLLRGAIQLVDVAFAVTNINATLRRSVLLDSLPEIVEPANAFLLLNRSAGPVNLFFSCAVPLNFLLVQNSPPPIPAAGPRQHGDTGMHQHSADRVMAPTTVPVPAAVDALSQANSARAPVGEFRSVLNKEDRALQSL